MTAEEAISYIEHYGWSTTRLGLGRTKELLQALGDPQKKLKFIHVAGSNGKGSTCAMFDAILRKAGYKCGLYTSPYIQDFCERIQIDGKNIPGDQLAEITERVMQLAEKMEDHPSQFELVTAIAMQYFYEQKCDIVVLEVGMGGALDSTNAIDAPELACITNIGLEHTEYLGDTLEEIAETKAGIIKTGCSCVCYDGAPEVTEVVKRVCEERDVPFTGVDISRLQFVSGNLDGQTFIWKCLAEDAEENSPDGHESGAEITEKEYRLALLGGHQLHNAALVLTGIEVLKRKGWSIREDAIREGLANVKWPARLEVLSRDPIVILDGGHNPQCAEALTDSLKQLLPGHKVVFLAGVLRDKDYDRITELMIPYAREFVCVTPVSDRALPGEEFAAYIESRGIKATACDSIEEGIFTALMRAEDLKKELCLQSETREHEPEGQTNVPVVIFGSLYLAGAARTAFRGAFRKALRKQKIRARDSIAPEQRRQLSEAIVQRILDSEIYRNAKTILIYDAVRGEVRLESLKEPAAQAGKKLVYPRCIDGTTMKALLPEGPDSFAEGAFGIKEPIPERSEEIAPEDIDLVICPGTVFDEHCNRIGMGAGYYDRYLEKCVHAKICAAAFETQFVKEIPAAEWDAPMDVIFTESRTITKQ